MNLFTVIPVSSNDINLPKLDASQVTFFSSAEYGSAGHWLLQGGTNSLIDITTKNNALQQGAEPPVFNDDYVTLNGYPAGLTTQTTIDTAFANDSFCLVFKTQGSFSSDIILGNATLSAGDGGFFVALNSSGELYLSTREGAFSNKTIASGLQPNTWYFLGLSREFTPSGNKIISKLSSFDAVTFSSSQSYMAGSKDISLGNSSYNNANRPIDFAEFITFKSALSAESINAIYSRSKERMLDKGIAI